MCKMKIHYSAASDSGQRQSNQDNLRIGSILCSINTDTHFEMSGMWESAVPELLCVCDGIGGANMGDVAAALALEGVAAVAAASDIRKSALEKLVLEAAEEAHRRVCNFFQKLGRPGGCTMSLVAVFNGRFAFLNIGDSPAFLWKQSTRQMTELSCRHNLEWHKRRSGIVPGENDACYLMRFIGKSGCSVPMMAHIATGELDHSDRILLCSDGVTNEIPLEQIRSELSENASAAKLVNHAALAPCADNCTAIILQA